MNNLIISFNVVFPLMAMMLTGFVLQKKGLLSEEVSVKMNKVVFRVFLPCMLFKNIYTSNIEGGFNWKISLFAVVFITGTFLVLTFLIPLFVKDNRKRSVMLQGCFRSNFVIYGLPVTISLLGETNAGITAILISVVVPLYNLLAILSFQIFGDTKLNIKNFLIGIVKNPLIITSLVGIVCLLLRLNSQSWFGFNFALPDCITDTISKLGSVTTPLSFVLLGTTFKFDSVRKNTAILLATSAVRLVIMPVIGISIATLCGFRGVDFVALLVMLSTPNAVSSYTMAQEYNADYTLAGEIVVFTTIMSIVSMFFIIFVSKQLGLF